MSLSFNNIQFDYNSTVIISYLLISLGAWFLNIITRGLSNKLLFTSYRSSPFNPLTYIRMFTHSIGHKDLDHLISNFLYILLIGPMIEEKYGSINLLVMLLITSFIIALYNIIFDDYIITGASGNVYMLIVLSSFSNISEGKIPITVLLICTFYVITEIKKKILEGNKKIYHDGHLIGAICGLAFGFLFLKYPDGIFSLLKGMLKL
ncbi:MAG: rhomboid family intramembrane serine protease [Bacilli bacterium]|nr:rhomboid family intramembrane serine protease [Bacilli bacterium]